MPVECYNLLELADENCHLSSDLVRSSDTVPTTHNNSVSKSLTAGEQLATQVPVYQLVLCGKTHPTKETHESLHARLYVHQ